MQVQTVNTRNNTTQDLNTAFNRTISNFLFDYTGFIEKCHKSRKIPDYPLQPAPGLKKWTATTPDVTGDIGLKSLRLYFPVTESHKNGSNIVLQPSPGLKSESATHPGCERGYWALKPPALFSSTQPGCDRG